MPNARNVDGMGCRGIVLAVSRLPTLGTLTIQHALNVTQLLSNLTRKAAGMGRQYSDMTIEELIDHALKYSSRISETDAVIELSQRVLSAQRALDAEREKVAKLEKIQAIDLKNNNEYREQLATLQAQLRQAEGERDAAQALVSERASMIGRLTAALRRAKAEGWREAAKELRAKAKTIHDEAVTWGWGETAGQLSRLASTLDARAAKIEEGE